MIKEIKLPEIADNVVSAVVLEVLVSVGDTVEKDDSLADMESDKATFELPSDFSGTVKEIKVKDGDTVKVGQTMFTIDTSEAGKEKADDDKSAKKDQEAGDDEPGTEEGGVTEEDTIKKARDSEDTIKKARADQDEAMKSEMDAEETTPQRHAAEVPAPPSVRRLAREIGVDIYRVKGSGPHDRITSDDVKAYAKKILEVGTKTVATDDYELPDFSKWGGIRREKMDSIRKITAKVMAESWQSIPHVFQFDKADVTSLEEFRKKYARQVEKKGAKLTVTAILLKLTAEALKTFPKFNASLDMKNEEIVYKDYINIGVAVDTDRGLLVPVIRDADKKSITELSIELNEMAEKARNRKIKLDELQGGNFAISNLGGIGGTNFTPIVYRPNVAILGVSRSQTEPVYIDGEFQPRMMLPLSLSYDHRIIDGADGARFLRWLCEALENPLVTLM